MCCKADPNDEVRDIFNGLPVEFARYDGDGADIGSHQHCAVLTGGGYQVSLSTRAYPHRKDWLLQFVKWANFRGPILYGTAGSKESGYLHLRTHAFGILAEELRQYPKTVNSRPESLEFESGPDNLTLWYERQFAVLPMILTWDAAWFLPQWHQIKNGFRTGDQSDMLVWDRHTLIYSIVSEEDKEDLRKLCFGLDNNQGKA